ncbi:MAG: hypothetical protein ABIA04_15160 [Pseudomonadota bacterium]
MVCNKSNVFCLINYKLIFFVIVAFVLLINSSLPKNFQEAENEQKRIFIIFSYPIGPWTKGILRGFEQKLKNGNVKYELKTYVYHSLYFINKSDTVIREEIETIKQKIKDFKADYIIVFDDEAADEIVSKMYSLEIPILFGGINKKKEDVKWLKKNRNITGYFEWFPYGKSLNLLLNLTNNKVKKISIISSQNPTSKIIIDQMKTFFEEENKTQVKLSKIYKYEKWTEWKNAVLEMNKSVDACYLVLPYNVVDKQGIRMDLKVMANWLQANVKIPGLAISAVGLSMGMIATIAITPEIVGEDLGNLIYKNVKKNISINKMTYQSQSKGEIMINKSKMDLLGLKIPIDLLNYAIIYNNPKLNMEE